MALEGALEQVLVLEGGLEADIGLGGGGLGAGIGVGIGLGWGLGAGIGGGLVCSCQMKAINSAFFNLE